MGPGQRPRPRGTRLPGAGDDELGLRLPPPAARLPHLAQNLGWLADTARELRESQRALDEARRKAEAASHAKSRLLATVSHEFRTPLNGILGLTGLLLETEQTPNQEAYARAVHSSGEALLALVDDMLDFSKIEAGRLDLRPQATDVASLVQEIAEGPEGDRPMFYDLPKLRTTITERLEEARQARLARGEEE